MVQYAGYLRLQLLWCTLQHRYCTIACCDAQIETLYAGG